MKTALLFLMICYHHNRKAKLICILLEDVIKKLIYTTYLKQSYFHLPKNTISNISNINILFTQTLRDIILLFHDISGLVMNLEEWKQLCHKAWGNEYDYLQLDRFAKIGEGRYTIRNCNRTTYTERTPETKIF